MQTITPIELSQRLAAHPGLPLIDVRTPVEFAEAHVGAARNIPLDTLNPKALVASGHLPKDAPIYILCRSGKRAQTAADAFAREGLDNAVVVEGGTLAWIEAGLPVERAAVKVISLERQVRIGAGALVLLGVLLGWLVSPYLYLISGAVGAGLLFAGISDHCGLGLLLAKAPWNKRL